MENTNFVQVSPLYPRYFALSNGTPYIPIGLNLCFVRFSENADEGLAHFQSWIQALAQNGGNYFRLWLSHPFFDIEHTQAGVYDESHAQRIDVVLGMARRYGMRVKLCLEHFRTLDDLQPPFKGAPSFGKPIFHVSRGGPASDMRDYFHNPASRGLFLKKLDFYATRYGSDPVILGWELWNEINAVKGEGWLEWTADMLSELNRRFPRNLALQSLGGFEYEHHRQVYQSMARVESSPVAQVHRYLNPGSELAVCRGAMDVLAADAVREVLALSPGKPVILTETGAVEANHAGPFSLYSKDRDGILLHDMLFAPFFAGAAGPGHAWHWDFYVEKNNLWHHFDRFAQVVSGIDPARENFKPLMLPHTRLRVYALVGKSVTLLWCRDGLNTWESELAQEIAPTELTGQVIPLIQKLVEGITTAMAFDPWKNTWSELKVENGTIQLPTFHRSIIVKIK